MGPRVGALCAWVVLIVLSLVLRGSLGAPSEDLVTNLLGQPKVAFRQYAGYINVDETNGRNLFYYFVEAATDAQSKPLTLWLNGGPGCSSIGGGGFEELGPFRPSMNGQSLVFNNYSWIQESSIIFLESPAGVGFSYSNTKSDYSNGDKKTAQDSLTFMLRWLIKYPEYEKRDFYIAGESYAGHYVPQLAAAIIKNNKVGGKLQIHLKGIMIGNPVLDAVMDLEYSPIEYAWGHGMMSEATHDIIIKECKFNISVVENKACGGAEKIAFESESTIGKPGSYINPYDIFDDVCLNNINQQGLMLREKYAGRTFGVDPCIDDWEAKYLNLPEVQSALHARLTNWSICSTVISDNYTQSDIYIEILPILGDLLKGGLRVWVFSGDADVVVPLIGTRKLINTLAGNLKLNVSSTYQPWFQGKQVGGWSISWASGSLVYSTVRGAGHMVPQTQPTRGLQLFASFIAGTMLPLAPSKL